MNRNTRFFSQQQTFKNVSASLKIGSVVGAPLNTRGNTIREQPEDSGIKVSKSVIGDGSKI